MPSRLLALGSSLALALLLAAAPPATAGLAGEPAEIASGLATPWDVVQPGDGRTLVVELPGRIRVVEGPGAGQVLLSGDASTRKFLGLVAHPDYARNRLLYLYVSDGVTGGNRIVRLLDEGSRLTVQRTIFDGIDSDGSHDGGRMAFGPDGHLYVTTGDVHEPARPQDRQSLNGKILRLLAPGTDADGGAPADNPFVAEGGNAAFVWSYGHRHPQGLAFDAAGRLYSSEHGPSGERHGPAYPGGNGRCCRDEVNLIERGENYGWPLISGSESSGDMRPPLATSGPDDTWAPGGLATAPDGHLYMPGLRGAHLREFTLSADGRTVTGQIEHYRNRFGRLRAATAACGGLYFTQDGGSASLLRTPLAPAPACPAPGSPQPQPQPQPQPPAPPAVPATGGVPPATQPSAPPARTSTRTALHRLLERAARSLRAGSPRRLRRSGRFRARAGGLDRGRLTLRLERRRGRPRTLATGTTRVRDRRAVGVRPRLTRTGRRVLRNRTRARLVLRAVHVSTGGTRTSARRRVTL